jgi:hypothetical protein
MRKVAFAVCLEMGGVHSASLSVTMGTPTYAVHAAMQYYSPKVYGINWRRYILEKHTEQANHLLDGSFPLHLALSNRYIAQSSIGLPNCLGSAAYLLIQRLVQLNPDALRLADRQGFTPLHCAIQYRFIFDLDFVISSQYEECIVHGLGDYIRKERGRIKRETRGYQMLIRHCPDALRMPFPDTGRLPLHVAAEKIPVWNCNVEEIAKADPSALLLRDPLTKLYPFMIAAMADSIQPDVKPVSNISVVYELLRMKPEMNAYWNI